MSEYANIKRLLEAPDWKSHEQALELLRGLGDDAYGGWLEAEGLQGLLRLLVQDVDDSNGSRLVAMKGELSLPSAATFTRYGDGSCHWEPLELVEYPEGPCSGVTTVGMVNGDLYDIGELLYGESTEEMEEEGTSAYGPLGSPCSYSLGALAELGESDSFTVSFDLTQVRDEIGVDPFMEGISFLDRLFIVAQGAYIEVDADLMSSAIQRGLEGTLDIVELEEG